MSLEFIESTTIISLLRTLGLTRYETLAYLTLVKDGPQSCRSLAKTADISNGKIYATAKSLADKGWAIITNDRPKMIHAINPEMAMKRCLTELKDKLHNLERSANKTSSILKPSFDQSYSDDQSMITQHNNRKKVQIINLK